MDMLPVVKNTSNACVPSKDGTQVYEAEIVEEGTKVSKAEIIKTDTQVYEAEVVGRVDDGISVVFASCVFTNRWQNLGECIVVCKGLMYENNQYCCDSAYVEQVNRAYCRTIPQQMRSHFRYIPELTVCGSYQIVRFSEFNLLPPIQLTVSNLFRMVCDQSPISNDAAFRQILKRRLKRLFIGLHQQNFAYGGGVLVSDNPAFQSMILQCWHSAQYYPLEVGNVLKALAWTYSIPDPTACTSPSYSIPSFETMVEYYTPQELEEKSRATLWLLSAPDKNTVHLGQVIGSDDNCDNALIYRGNRFYVESDGLFVEHVCRSMNNLEYLQISQCNPWNILDILKVSKQQVYDLCVEYELDKFSISPFDSGNIESVSLDVSNFLCYPSWLPIGCPLSGTSTYAYTKCYLDVMEIRYYRYKTNPSCCFALPFIPRKPFFWPAPYRNGQQIVLCMDYTQFEQVQLTEYHKYQYIYFGFFGNLDELDWQQIKCEKCRVLWQKKSYFPDDHDNLVKLVQIMKTAKKHGITLQPPVVLSSELPPNHQANGSNIPTYPPTYIMHEMTRADFLKEATTLSVSVVGLYDEDELGVQYYENILGLPDFWSIGGVTAFLHYQPDDSTLDFLDCLQTVAEHIHEKTPGMKITIYTTRKHLREIRSLHIDYLIPHSLADFSDIPLLKGRIVKADIVFFYRVGQSDRDLKDILNFCREQVKPVGLFYCSKTANFPYEESCDSIFEFHSNNGKIKFWAGEKSAENPPDYTLPIGNAKVKE